MAVTETVTESWGSRLGSSMKGIIGGIAMFIAAFPLLWWNEGNTIKTARALEEGEANCVPVESPAQIDPANEGVLVHMSGVADTETTLTDGEFGVSESKAIRLTRTVEMYQWLEKSHTTERKKVGGSVEKTTTYTYEKVWSEQPIDSSSFKEAGHDNPGVMEFQSDSYQAESVTFGAFRLAKDQIDRIHGTQPYKFAPDFVCPIERVKVSGNIIYIPNGETRSNALNQRDVVAQPRIGDMRATFTVVKPHEVSLVAKQHGDTFVAYTAKNKKRVSLMAEGVKDMEEMFADAQSANSFRCWLIRLGGFILMFLGISAILKPLSVVLDVLPFLGNIAEVGIAIVAFAVAGVCSLVTIALAWLAYRPVIAIALLAAAGGLVYWFKTKKKGATCAKKEEPPAASATPSAE